jgi:hypothetical protein
VTIDARDLEHVHVYRQCKQLWDVDLCRWVYVSRGREIQDGYYVVSSQSGNSQLRSANDAQFKGPFPDPLEAQVALARTTCGAQHGRLMATVYRLHDGELDLFSSER